ncbi:SusC/RagA family TonB-linked outer membrane protein [Maribacter sp. HTCC2170]|uniref:SusC/RagA family TonB-linked outer membrane protein n=1 Tax=Maribacter sp. (strain HTCC2170 / KCCM 42371) TaxID=313603 RepID=UPI00006BB847|nr:SusC/RagA family TonB-linked outer membrane protein [Maribacter sp. HTCC2170]EAQ99730.1 putative outer membrane protein [Maribacter sp. HTCC2170]
MKKKVHYFLTVLALLCIQGMIAQTKTVSGTVTDASDGSPLPGVNVLVQGTTNGAQTDFDGNYSIQASEGDVLLFSYLGMKSQSATVGSSSTINVTMEEDAEALDEVVVTALGIKRKEKTLTYAQQTVGGEELTNTRDVNFVNSISGKAAGVEIRKSSSGPGGSTKIQIRGSKSLNGDSSPLFVIDGIPMVNNKGSQPGLWDGVDQGDGLSQLNPDDIESMSILKGANAAILYGSQGANGVVIITTKSGKEGAATVQFNTGITFESIIDTPELQFRYGSEGGTKESWSTTRGDYDSNYVDDYFETGVNYFNSVSVSGGNEKTQAYFSYANTTSSGVTPMNDYGKNNLTFKQSTKLFNDKVKVTSNILLAQEKTDGRNRAGYYNNPLTGLYWFPRDRNFNDFKNNYSVPNLARNTNEMNWFIADHLQSNPYWLLNEESQEDKTSRVIGSLNIEYDISEEFKFQLRGNYDYAAKEFNNQRNAGGNTTTVPSNGRWRYEKYDDTSVYLDGILTYNETFGEDFTLSALAGGTYQKTTFGNGVAVDTGGSADGLQYANEFYFQNLLPVVQVRSTLDSRVEKQSLFANATFGYKEMLFLDVAGRNDWASTLALTGNDSYFYPSFGLTAILTEMFDMPQEISFAKFRASYASVGNEIPYNAIFPRHSINSDGSVNFNTTKPFTDAKPEIITTTEFGLDWRFFNNRLGLDLTYYNINSQDQFIRINQPIEDYTSFFVNAGEITNKGVEITLSGKPIVTEDLTWSTAFNYSNNTNEIVELHPDTQNIGQGGAEGISIRMVEGGSIGDIYARKFQRDDQGRILLDDGNGRPLRTDRELFGNAEPDYILGWSNTVNYKDWGLNVQVNGKFGGLVASQTEALLDGYGVSERSAVARDRGYEIINAVQNGSAVTQIDPFTYYDAIGGRNGIDEPHIYDRTSVRLAQLALSYNINVDSIDWVKNASVSFIGNNLFFFYKDAPFDPEIQQATGRNNVGIDNYNLPSTRTYGLNLSLTF